MSKNKSVYDVLLQRTLSSLLNLSQADTATQVSITVAGNAYKFSLPFEKEKILTFEEFERKEIDSRNQNQKFLEDLKKKNDDKNLSDAIKKSNLDFCLTLSTGQIND